MGDNTVVGNLVIQADTAFGGGEMSVSGPCTDCNDDGSFSMDIDATEFSVQSGGDVRLTAGNSNQANSPGGLVRLEGGDGTSTLGGTGGGVLISGGNGFGLASEGGNVGDGGDVTFLGGEFGVDVDVDVDPHHSSVQFIY